MYLTAGQYKGCKIIVPDNVKPTLSKVRQGVFNMLNQFDFDDYTFLDMFAGSALMGLEALSRGYKVKELEINPKAVQIIKQNYSKIKQTPDITLINSLKYETEAKFDVIYLDPPWDMDYQPIINKAAQLKSPNGVIVIEFDGTNDINVTELLHNCYINLELLKLKKYGRTRIAIAS